MENVFMKMVNIILSNGKKVLGMEEENCIIQLEKLNMKVILLKANMMVMEKTFLKMVNIIMVNLKMVYFNGKGSLYYENGNIKYEGDWINNKPEGNGKGIFKNDECYIGQSKKKVLGMEKENIIIKIEI